MTNLTTLEYRNKKDKTTPFETFLKYSHEKIDSSKVLSKIFNIYLKKNALNFLDIGSGDGSFLKMSLEVANIPTDIHFTLIEPSEDLLKNLISNSKKFPKNNGVNIINSTWEDYQETNKFDFILASHLYNLKKEEYYRQLKRMVTCLKPKGVLVFILRGIADPYRFQMKFKSILFGDNFRPTTLGDIVKVFKKISDTGLPLTIKKYHSRSEMKIPIAENKSDAITIIEFALNKSWQDIPAGLHKKILDYIIRKNEKFKTLDEFALIKRSL